MKYKLIIRPEAEEDLAEAFIWYEERRKGLGYDFLLQINIALRFLERNPLAFPEKYKGVRRCLIKRFPYMIFYLVEGQMVNILGVIYAGRDPKWVKKRIKGN